MATTLRGRRAAYDNIAAGAATGAERTISGDSVSKVEMYGGGFRTSTSTGEAWCNNVVAGTSVTNAEGVTNVAGGAIHEHIVAAAVTNTEELLGN